MTLKDPALLELLRALPLEERGWVVVDHWDADRTAIGVARSDEPRRLVYLCTHGEPEGRAHVVCEVPTGPSPTELEETEIVEHADVDTVLSVLDRHLGARRRS